MKYNYKKSEEDEINFIESIHKSNTNKNLDEHQLVEILTGNPNLTHQNFLLFYHWYERRYENQIINRNILASINQVISVTKDDLHDEVRDLLIQNMKSSRFPNYTIYYEYFYDFFPKIERFNFHEFLGKPFLRYVLDLFPHISEIDYMSRKTLFRFTNEEMKKMPNAYSFRISYKPNRLPSFYPHRKEEVHFYNPHSLLSITKRELENIIREEKSIPKIGEGWISETLLYYNIKNTFNEFEVINHASPEWLGRQHLDIFIPEKNIAIEYQGRQHTEPIEFFGGTEAFLKNQERDKRKLRLCGENGIKLLYVYPDTITSHFISKLKEQIYSEV